MNTSHNGANGEGCPIAIVGMGCLYPKARNLSEFWQMIRHGDDAITDTPPTHWSIEDYVDTDPKSPDMVYCGRGGFLPPIPFDPTEFGIPPTILEATDTSQLLSLIAAKAALEDAGYGESSDFNRERVSVILGVTGTQELVLPLSARLGHPMWRRALAASGVSPEVAEDVVQRIADGYVSWQENSFPGLLGNVVAGRIANRLNLRGTNCVVDAACAGAMGAMHMAMLELEGGRSDMVLTGGADTLNDIFMYMCFSKTTALSFTGDARPFSDEADGTVLGEGVGLLVLKRLEDAERDGDRIYAVIRNIGTSSDGRSQSIYAPHPAGQARALRDAYRRAGFGPDSVELIEAHGTGTKVGDVAEFDALRTVFREAQSDGRWCAIGSIKSQIGHAKAAAGAAGLIKAALAIYHRTVPPTIKVERPNPKMNVEESPFYISSDLRPWLPREDQPRRAGVSAFGFGGSNFHAVLEEHRAALPEVAWDGSVQIIALSASSREGLDESLSAWLDVVSEKTFGPELLAYRAAESRQSFDVSHPHRLCIVVERDASISDLLLQAKRQLNASPEKDEWSLSGVYYAAGEADQGKLAFLFPGQGSQYVGMGRELACTFPEVLAWLSEADKAGDHDERRLSDLIYPIPAFTEGERERQTLALTRTDVAQPALGAIELGMCRVLQRFGVRPEFAAGHSYGELVALCVAGRYDAATLHRLSRLRGRLMAQSDGEPGTMLAVRAPLDDLAALIEQEGLDVVIANRNAPTQGILSGTRESIGRAVAACEEKGYACKPLRVSGAFHSRLMETAMGPFRQALEAVSFETGAIPVFANTTAEGYPEDAAAARETLASQLTSSVNFVSEIEHLHDAGVRTFVEVGPKNVLTGLVSAILREGDRPYRSLAMDGSIGRRTAVAGLARLLAQLAALGRPVELVKWERQVSEPRKPKMVVPLVGANYRAPRPERAAEAKAERSVTTSPVSGHKHRTANVAESVPVTPMTVQAPIEKTKQATCADAQCVAKGKADCGKPANPGKEEDQTTLKEQEPVAPPEVGNPVSTPSSSPQPAAEGNRPPQAPSVPLASQPASSAPWVEAVQLVQEGLRAMQALQQQTASAHQRFLEGQELAHKAFQSVIEGQQRLLDPNQRPAVGPSVAPTPGAAAVPAAPPPPVVETPQVAPAPPVVEQTPPPPVRAETAASPAKPVEASTPPPVVTPEPPAPVRPAPAAVEPEAAPAGVDRSRMESVVLEVVCEKTGYPQEMLDLGMDIEADLGVDSIKRVEIVAAIEERVPEVRSIKPEHMGSIRTLEEIVAFMSEGVADAAPAGATNEPVGTATTETPASGGGASSGGAQRDAFVAALLAVVSELTGYPQEMLELGMDMEADLGIDSIKRVEILAAVEARMPDMPAVKPEYMGSLRTLQQVVDYACGEADDAREENPAGSTRTPAHVSDASQPAAVTDENEQKTLNTEKVTDHVSNEQSVRDVTAAGDASVTLDRRVLKTVDLPQISERPIPLAPGREIWLTCEGTSLAREIAACLDGACVPARIIDPDAEVDEERLAMVGGLILISPPAEAGTDLWEAKTEAWLKKAFHLTKRVSDSLRQAGVKGGATLVTVSRMDGVFGLAGGRFDPAQGGLAGLAKTAAKEWPEVRCRALDISLEWRDMAAIAESIVHELGAEGPIEVGLDAGARRTIETIEEAAPKGTPSVSEGDVVVVTGGARGVTAETALVLARECRPTLVLVGRSPLPVGDEPEWLHGLQKKAEIKRAIAKNGSWPEGRPSPAVLNAEYAKCVANREVRNNLERLNATGAKIMYRSVDVRDPEAVRGLMDSIRSEHGPIRGLIHAAGVLADRRIQDKTPEQFDSVFDTKIVGLRCLLGALELEDLRHVVLFSSVAGRYGNQGQVDYAMANEVLNKAAGRLSARLPKCRVVSINWGPWDGGMVTPALKREFERQGVYLIPMAAGAQCLLDELRSGGDRSVEVVIGAALSMGGDSPKTAGAPEVAAAPAKKPAPVDSGADAFALAFERKLDLERHPFLRSHVIDGHAVLPVAVAMEWLAHTALHTNPGLLFHGFDDLRVLRGLVLGNDPVTLRFMVRRARQSGGVFDVDVELRSVGEDGVEVPHVRGTAVLMSSLPEAPDMVLPDTLTGRPYRRSVSEAYGDVLFHGSAFRGIRQVDGCSEMGLVARVAAAPTPQEWMSDPLRSHWLTDPLAVDCAFQAAILWCREEMNAPSLPAHVGRYRQYRGTWPAEGVTTGLLVRERSPHKVSGDLVFLDADNRLVARIEAYECTVDPSLEAAFRRATIVAVSP